MIRATHARASAGHGRRVFRQRGGDGRRDGRALLSARRTDRYGAARGADAHADEGRDAQPSDGDRAVPGRGDRLGRRNPRRRRDRRRRASRRRASSASPCRTCAFPGSTQPWEQRRRQARPHRVRAVDHARRPDRRRVVQQRIRPAEPRRLLPHVRAGGRRRSARLSQADHDRGRRRQHPRRPHAQASAAGGHAAGPARRPRHADRHGRRRGVVDGDRRQHRRPRLRFGAARQRGDRAARAGGDRPLLAARRGQSDPVDSRRRRGRPVERVAGARRTAAAPAARSSCARFRPRSRAWRRARSGATKRRSATCSPSRRASLPMFDAICERERCPFAVVGTANARRPPGRRAIAHFRQPAGRRAARRDPRQAAEDDARRAPRRAHAAAARLAGRRRSRTPLVSRAAAAGGGRQDVPGHDRRSHRRRTVLARPDGRTVAGAGGRRRGHAHGLRGLRRRSDGDGRAHAARADRCACVGAHGGRRGDHQSRRGRHRATRRRQALGELDGAGGASGRGRRALRHRARGGARTLHPRSAWRFRSARTRCRCARRGATTAATRRSRRRCRSIVSAFAPVADVRADAHAAAAARRRRHRAACCSTSRGGRRRLGGSALAQVYGQLGNDAPDLDDPARLGGVLRVRSSSCAATAVCSPITTSSDGGLFVDAARNGVRLALRPRHRARRIAAIRSPRCSPKSSARSCRSQRGDARRARRMRRATPGLAAAIDRHARSPATACASRAATRSLLDESRVDLHRAWSSTTHAMQRLRDNPDAADAGIRAPPRRGRSGHVAAR